MNKLAILLAIGASAVFVTAANAAPLSSNLSIIPANGVENVRMVCDQNGQCFRTRGGQRVVIQRSYDSYNYAPRETYVQRPGYYDSGYYNSGYYNSGPSVGIGVGPVGIGIGVGPRW